MLRSVAELAAYGTLATLLAVASLAPETRDMASSATTGKSASASGTTTPSRALNPAAERGALLFAVKGCIGCHTHSSFPSARMQVGPDLTGLADRAGSTVAGLGAVEYVRQSLREPGAYRVSGYSMVMPDLGFSEEQVESLTAFLLSRSR